MRARSKVARPAGDAAAFAAVLRVSSYERAAIVATLERMPLDQKCRGMFFHGVFNVLQFESSDARRVLADLSIEPPRTPFGLVAHYDFYKLCFWAAAHFYPGVPVDEGLYNVAACFFPIFKESMVGKTMASLMGTRAGPILSRLVDAYRLCVPMNKHEIAWRGATCVEWSCDVELGDFYPAIFRGIVLGTMREQGVPDPVVEVTRRTLRQTHQSLVISIRWRD